MAFYLGLIYSIRTKLNALIDAHYYILQTGEITAMKYAICLYKPFTPEQKKALREGYKEGCYSDKHSQRSASNPTTK